MKTIPALLFGGALLALAGSAAAASHPSVQHSGYGAMNHPVNLMTMQQVEQNFGAPVKKIPAVGNPPISRWIYPHYIVYFEGNLVLHTVSKKKPFHDAPPESTVKHIVSGDEG